MEIRRLIFIALLLSLLVFHSCSFAESLTQEIMATTGVEGGLVVHLGCGDVILPGFVNVDVRALHRVDVVHDCRDLSFLSPDSCELIYACHLLEHFWPTEAAEALSQWHRVLRPGGVLRLAVPDFEAICRLYRSGFDVSRLRGLLYGSRTFPDYPEDTHHSCWDFRSLEKELRRAGFHSVARYNWKETEHAQFDDCASAYMPRGDLKHGTLASLNVEATK